MSLDSQGDVDVSKESHGVRRETKKEFRKGVQAISKGFSEVVSVTQRWTGVLA